MSTPKLKFFQVLTCYIYIVTKIKSIVTDIIYNYRYIKYYYIIYIRFGAIGAGVVPEAAPPSLSTLNIRKNKKVKKGLDKSKLVCYNDNK